jgi:copper chaperone CopZ
MNVLELEIDGMTCDGCVQAVKNVLGRVAHAESFDVRQGRAVLRFGSGWDGEPDAAIAAIEKAGFSAKVASPPRS